MAISVSTTFAGTLACFPRLATTMALACITLLIGFNAAVSETASSRAEDEPGNWLAHFLRSTRSTARRFHASDWPGASTYNRRVLLGTGNGSPWPRAIRSPGGGDNLFLSCIVAVDASTDRYKWHYQTTPADNWDYTATQDIALAKSCCRPPRTASAAAWMRSTERSKSSNGWPVT